MKRSDGFILEFDVHSTSYTDKTLPLLFISFTMKHDTRYANKLTALAYNTI